MTKDYTIEELYDMIHEGQDIYDEGYPKKFGYAKVTEKRIRERILYVDYIRYNGTKGTAKFRNDYPYREQVVDDKLMFKKGGWDCWLVIQGECHQCIYICKGNKKCALFTEEAK